MLLTVTNATATVDCMSWATDDINFQSSFMAYVLLLVHSTDEETVLERGFTHFEVGKNPTLCWFAEMGRIITDTSRWGNAALRYQLAEKHWEKYHQHCFHVSKTTIARVHHAPLFVCCSSEGWKFYL